MTVLVTVAAVAGAMALVLSIAIARMDVAEARPPRDVPGSVMLGAGPRS
jgi:hypothetical protein